jgi:Mn2+/Fe2+ NRAMP family transporter
MATSAIGPGFITQTTVFTQQLLTSFGFVILVSIVLDIAAQLNVWRIIAVTEKRAQDLANTLLPGMGYLLAILIVGGGLIFNIGNVAGAGLGMNVVFPFDDNIKHPVIGAAISAGIALLIFWIKEAGVAMDWFARILGFVMIGLTGYVAISSHPPVAQALYRSFVPVKIDTTAILTHCYFNTGWRNSRRLYQFCRRTPVAGCRHKRATTIATGNTQQRKRHFAGLGHAHPVIHGGAGRGDGRRYFE